MSGIADPISARVHRMEWAADEVLAVELRRPSGEALPAFTPGAHLDIDLPNGLSRSYSLLNDCSETHRYVVGVGLDAATRGGSRFIHQQLRVGHTVTISPPRNHFPLVEDAPHVILIAGGIGVTPLVCMARRLATLDRSFEIHIAARNQQRAAFLDEIRALGRPVHTHFDADHGGAPLDLAPIVKAAPAGTHLYCCGPTGMLAAFEAATSDLPPKNVHVEYFKPKEIAATPAGIFTVELLRGGKTFEVPPDKSILQVLLEHGIDAEYSCQDGVCGTCETRVSAGIPDHRDSLLSKAERDSNKTMMICVSRCLGDRLVLEL